jgi:hypothetical protein
LILSKFLNEKLLKKFASAGVSDYSLFKNKKKQVYTYFFFPIIGMVEIAVIAGLVIIFIIAAAAFCIAIVAITGTDALPNGKINVGNDDGISKAVTLSGGATIDNTGVVTLNTTFPTQNIAANIVSAASRFTSPEVEFVNPFKNTIDLHAPSAAFTNYQLILPNTAGTAGQVLTTDGTGILSWKSASSLAVSLPYAEYVQSTQAPNNSVPPGTAISYLVDNPTGVFNTAGITTAIGPGGTQGTSFNLPLGSYIVDFENSASTAESIAVYQGATNLILAVLANSTTGATTVTTWIHGRTPIVSTVGNQWIMISPVVGTLTIPTAGTASGFIARVTFLKVG